MTRWLDAIRKTLGEWGRWHWIWGLAVGTYAAYDLGSFWFMAPDLWLPVWGWNVGQFGLPYVFLIRVADHAVAAGASRVFAYMAVVLLVGPIGITLSPLLAMFLDFPDSVKLEWAFGDTLTVIAARYLSLGLATLTYVYWRRGHEAQARLGALEVERARLQSSLQSARLLALQAQVEPGLLSELLGRVHAAIDPSAADVERADRKLTDAIALLRAMQPAVDASGSTVERELALVHAFGRAVEMPALEPGRLELRVSDEARGARLAPLVLVPALRSLASAAAQARWRLTAAAAAGRLNLEIAATAAEDAARDALRAVPLPDLGARLAAAHGPDARIEQVADGPPALRIDVPLSPVTCER